MITNNGKTAAKLTDTISTLFSQGPQFDANHIIEFKVIARNRILSFYICRLCCVQLIYNNNGTCGHSSQKFRQKGTTTRVSRWFTTRKTIVTL